MGIGSFFRNLFGTRSDSTMASGKSQEYQGYTIRATPQRQGGQYLTAGVIEKTFPDGVKSQTFIRADTHSDPDSAGEHALQKGRQIIDEQGDHLFQVKRA